MYASKDSDVSRFDEELISAAGEVFTMLADVTRIKIILALSARDELSVGALAEIVERRPPAVSQHLAKMRMLKMVVRRQEGTSVYYQLADEHALALVREALNQAEHALVEAGQTPTHHTSKN